MSGRDSFRLVSIGFDRFRPIFIFTGFYWFVLV